MPNLHSYPPPVPGTAVPGRTPAAWRIRRAAHIASSTLRAFWSGLKPEPRIAWSGTGWHRPTADESPDVFVRSLGMDGYDHGADGTLPRSAGDWPAWLILALRPWFALSVDRATRRQGVNAWRLGFWMAQEETRSINPLTMTR